jgi:hypothetical protein
MVLENILFLLWKPYIYIYFHTGLYGVGKFESSIPMKSMQNQCGFQ